VQSSGTYLSRPAQVSCLNTEHIEQAASWRSMGAWGCVVGGARRRGSAQLQAHVRRGAQRGLDFAPPRCLIDGAGHFLASLTKTHQLQPSLTQYKLVWLVKQTQA